MTMAKIGITVNEQPITAEELYTADEIFTGHTGIKVSPVKRFEQRELPAPAPVTRKIMDLMVDILTFKDDRFSGWFQRLA